MIANSSISKLVRHIASTDEEGESDAYRSVESHSMLSRGQMAPTFWTLVDIRSCFVMNLLEMRRRSQ